MRAPRKTLAQFYPLSSRDSSGLIRLYVTDINDCDEQWSQTNKCAVSMWHTLWHQEKKKKRLTAARAWLKHQTFTQHLKLCGTHKQSGLMASFIKEPVRIHKIIKWNTLATQVFLLSVKGIDHPRLKLLPNATLMTFSNPHGRFGAFCGRSDSNMKKNTTCLCIACVVSSKRPDDKTVQFDWNWWC